MSGAWPGAIVIVTTREAGHEGETFKHYEGAGSVIS
jgi:hypothetical protein